MEPALRDIYGSFSKDEKGFETMEIWFEASLSFEKVKL
jgi:hypothetical protein